VGRGVQNNQGGQGVEARQDTEKTDREKRDQVIISLGVTFLVLIERGLIAPAGVKEINGWIGSIMGGEKSREFESYIMGRRQQEVKLDREKWPMVKEGLFALLNGGGVKDEISGFLEEHKDLISSLLAKKISWSEIARVVVPHSKGKLTGRVLAARWKALGFGTSEEKSSDSSSQEKEKEKEKEKEAESNGSESVKKVVKIKEPSFE